MDLVEALMSNVLVPNEWERYGIQQRALGKKISTVKNPYYACPFCLVEKSALFVFEYGVMWPCGHARSLPPLHGGERQWIACKKCNDGVVVPMHGGRPRKKPQNAAEELSEIYEGLA